MSRFFSTRYETRSIHEGIERDLTRTIGTRIWWYRFDEAGTTVDDVYDMGVGRAYKDPFYLDVVAAIRVEGREQRRDEGLFTRDRLEVIISWGEIKRREMTDIETATESYLKDRVIYEGVVFTVQSIEVEGSLRDRDTIVSLSLEEVRPDQQYHDLPMPPATL